MSILFAKNSSYRPWAVRTVVVRLSRKITATYRIRNGRLLSRLLAALLANFSTLAMALPTDVNVVAGQATISTTSADTMLIQQGSDKAILNWRSFGIGTGQSVRFVQPNAASVALNRVIGTDPTAIHGALSANGHVFLINPVGVMFAPGAQVNVGGLVASSLAISNEDFVAGRYIFNHTGSSGSVVNHGSINTERGGYVLLAAPSVSNTGTISTDAGSTGLAAGSRVSLDTSGAGLVRFSVDAAAVNAVAANSGGITAQGGQVVVLASALGDAMATVINQTGVIRATSAIERNGLIVLSGGARGVVRAAGLLDASGSAPGQSGGTVKVLGDKVMLASGARIDASGHSGGGTVLVGGNYQGNGPEQNAALTLVASGASIDASATRSRNGGNVVVWADGATGFYGAIKSTGGAEAGDGGVAEVSGKQTLAFDGAADLSAARGRAGTLLLDPLNIIVSSAGPAIYEDVSTFVAQAGTTQTVSTGTLNAIAGNIVLQATNDITLSTAFNVAAGKSISLEANNNINISTGSALTTSGSAITLKADADAVGGGNLEIGAALSSNGGAITLSGANINSTTGGTIASTGAVGVNGGNLQIAATGTVNLADAVNAAGGAAGTGGGRNAGTVSINGAGVTTLSITASGSNAGGASLAGGSGGAVSITSTNGVMQTGTIIASGGAGSAGNGAGGNAGSITVSNTTAGVISIGALTVSTGAAVGTGSGGTAGSISLSNTATGGSLATNAITTTGGTKGNGGNVNISALGLVTIVNNIISSGGATISGLAGRNAGNITIAGGGVDLGTGSIIANGVAAAAGGNEKGGSGAAVAITSTGAITTGAVLANGGAGGTTNGAGGNAGSITLTNSGTGNIGTGNLAAQTGNAAGTGAGGAVGSITLNGASVTTGALTTTGGANGSGGAVSVTSTAGELTTGDVLTSGGSANAGNAGRNAGTVMLQANGGLLTGTRIIASGSNGMSTGDRAGGNGAVISVTGDSGIALTNLAASGGAGAGVNAAGGNAGSITLTNSGPGNIGSGNLSAQNGNAVGTGAGGAVGSITLNGASVTTGALTTTGGANGSGGAVSVTSTAGALTAGDIFTSGGSANAGNAGRNAGTVMLQANGGLLTGARIIASGSNGASTGDRAGGNGAAISVTGDNGITVTNLAASGGVGVGVNAAGGNAATITLANSGTGNIGTGTLTAQTGNAVGTGTGGTAGNINLSNTATGGTLATTAITTTGGTKGNGGNVNISALGQVSIVNHNIITSGGATVSGLPGRNAGTITIAGGGVNLGTGSITANGVTAAAGGNEKGGSGATVAITSTGAITTGAITANGGAGGTTNGAGGNAGTITVLNNSATTGTIGLGAVTVRTGAARGTGAGGVAGSISVTNNAANADLTTTAIDTNGAAGSNGGAVALASQAGVTVNGTLNTSGTLLAAGTRAGSNAGNVTITGVNRSVTGAISANGSEGFGANQTGGNAGVVSITGSGTLGSNIINASTGNATGIGAGGTVGSITLSGSTAVVGVLTTTGGLNGKGGDVSVTSRGPLAVSGIAANVGAGGSNRGDVTLLAGNAISQTGVIVARNLTATSANAAGAAISLANAGNDVLTVNLQARGGSVAAPGSTNANGAISYRDANAVEISGFNTGIGGGGDVTIVAGGTITQTGGINALSLSAKTLSAGTSNIRLTNSGNDATTVNLQSRNVADTANAAGFIEYRDANGFDAASIATNGALTLQSNGNITQSGAVTASSLVVTETGTGSVNLGTRANAIASLNAVSAAGGFAFNNGNNNLVVAGLINTAGGDGAVLIDAGTGTYTQNDVDVTAGSGSITVTADTVTIAANSGSNALTTTGVLTLKAKTANRAMSLAGSSAFDVSALEIAAIATGATGTLVVGDVASTGALTIGASIDLTGKTLMLNAGTITDAGVKTVTANNVILNANGQIGASSANGIDVAATNLSVNTTGNANAFVCTGAINLGAAGGGSSVGSGTLELIATGAITQTALTGKITAGTLNVKTLSASTAGITLTNSGNDAANILLQTRNSADTDHTAAGIAYTDTNAVVVAGINNGSGAGAVGNVALLASGAITQSGAIKAATFTATTANGTAGAGVITLTDASNNAATVNLQARTGTVAAVGAANAATAIQYTGGGAVTTSGINTGTGAGGNVTLRAGGVITQSGAIKADTLSVRTLSAGTSGITLTHSGNDAAVIDLQARNAGDTADATGAVQYTDVNVVDVATVRTSGNATLAAGGAVTQSGAIAAAGLALTGTGAAYTLRHTGNAVTTLAANTGSVDYSQGDALTVGTVGVAGVTTSGVARLETTGAASDLTLNAAVSSAASGDAVVLKAGSTNAAGVSGGGKLVNNVGVNGIVAFAGRYLAYSEDPGTTLEGVTGYNKRYNTDAGFMPGGSANTFFYRIAPTLTVRANNQSKVYGDSNPLLTGVVDSGLIDGDTAASVGVSYTTTAVDRTRVSASPAAITVVATNNENYIEAFTDGGLTITPRDLTVSATGQNRAYDGSTLAAVTLADNRLSGDALTVSNTMASFADKNVGIAKTVNVTGISIGGADASNYTSNNSASSTADITPRALTVSATGQSRVYDGSTLAAVTLADNRVSGDALTVSNTMASFADKNVGIAKTVNVAGISIGGADAGNYTFNNSASTTADITVNGSPSVPGALPRNSLSALVVADINTRLERAPTSSFGSPGILMVTVREPFGQQDGLVQVTVAGELTRAGASFRFALPACLMDVAAASPEQVNATTLTGQPLPAWLLYDSGTCSFVATAVPTDALPLKARVSKGKRSVVLMISERR